MSIEVFTNKELTDLFEDIYNRAEDRKNAITQLITSYSALANNPNDLLVVAPVIKDLFEVLVRSDEHLVKMAAIAQRIAASESKGTSELLTDEERKSLIDAQKDLSTELSTKIEIK